MPPRSVNTIARTLIQTMVRQKLNSIKSDPERSLRNLVDMGLSFAGTGAQQRFLQQAQLALQDESSAYYRIIYDAVLHVDTEHLIGFGMNLGYNSLTAGSRIIRRLESERGYDIPWCLTLVLNRRGFDDHEAAYADLIEQGKKMGIYTYLLMAQELPTGLLPLLQQQRDCAFLLFAAPGDLTEDVIDIIAQLKNVVPVIRYEDGTEEICSAMRQREMLYSVFLPYHREKAENLLTDGVMQDIEQLHSPLTCFVAYTSPENCTPSPLYQSIVSARNDLHLQTIPVELWEDLRFIDSVISPRSSHSVAFDAEGRLIRTDGSSDSSLSFIEKPLEEILSARR